MLVRIASDFCCCCRHHPRLTIFTAWRNKPIVVRHLGRCSTTLGCRRCTASGSTWSNSSGWSGIGKTEWQHRVDRTSYTLWSSAQEVLGYCSANSISRDMSTMRIICAVSGPASGELRSAMIEGDRHWSAARLGLIAGSLWLYQQTQQQERCDWTWPIVEILSTRT